MKKPNWSTNNKYPLFTVVDQNRSNRIYMAYQANRLAHRISINLSEMGQFYCFAQEAEENGKASISMVVEDLKLKKFRLAKVTLSKSFQYDAMIQDDQIEVTV